MKGKKSKPISYKAVTKNKKLGEFVKEDKTKDIADLTFELLKKRDKKK